MQPTVETLAQWKEDFERLVDTRFAASDKAIDHAHASMEKRLDSLNEIRGALSDQAATFITRPEHETVSKQIEKLQIVQATQEGKASQNAVIVAYVISAAALAIGVIDLFKK